MCTCFALAAPDQTRTPSLSAPAVGRARGRELAHDGPWIDVHAHPGRCFLRGLDPADPAISLLGTDSVDSALDDIRAVGLSAVAFSTVADLRVLRVDPAGGIHAGREFEPGEAYRDHRRQLDALLEVANGGSVDLILEPTLPDSGKPGAFLTCEGGDFLEGRIERVEEAAEMGVRSITLVHYRINELGDIQTEAPRHQGLSAFGTQVVHEMNRLGLVIDLAHATFDVTKQGLDASQKPVMISHSHLSAPSRDHARLVSQEHALSVARHGGLIGAWPAGVAIQNFDEYLDEILRLVDLLGIDHVAIGTDMDANYKPVVDRYQQSPDIADGLAERGLATSEVDAIMGGNFWRLFGEVRS